MMELVSSLDHPPAQPWPPRRRPPAFSRVAGLLGLVALLHTSVASAVNAERGRQLYENQCQACHSNLLHTKEARKIDTLTELQRRVAAWGIHAGQDWGAEEVNDVTLYLDRTFYRFGEAVQ